MERRTGGGRQVIFVELGTADAADDPRPSDYFTEDLLETVRSVDVYTEKLHAQRRGP